ncbi:MAG: hypothetical protein ABL879_06485, partial [Devosia sp.]
MLAALLWLACGVAADAQEKATLLVTAETGFGRMILDFPSRLDLPAYKLNYDNGVLAITFTDPVQMVLPDAAVALPDYVSVGRVDPDKRGVRFGLRSAVTVHTMEAGERLFIDILPANWQGLPPSLPPEVVAELTERAKDAAKVAEQKRKAAEAMASHPAAVLTVGRNPTFLRLQFDWNVDADAKY